MVFGGALLFVAFTQNSTVYAQVDPAQEDAQTGAMFQRLPDSIPSEIFEEMTSGRRLVGFPSLVWNRRVLTVGFKGGSDEIYSLIEKTASEWTDNGGELRFSFRDDKGRFREWSDRDTGSSAAIRINFSTESGDYWSVIGRMAERVASSKPTMNFGGFEKDTLNFLNGKNEVAWKASYIHTVILHEFGHALGLAHEHFHPICQADLNMDETIKWLGGPPNNWSETMARFNINAEYYFKSTINQSGDPLVSPEINRNSVMLYSFPQYLEDVIYKAASKSPCKPSGAIGYATKLSDSDIAFYKKYYSKVRGAFDN
ncbi:MAG: hypothetical protein ACRC44_00035 [Bifidobacterium asteroides]